MSGDIPFFCVIYKQLTPFRQMPENGSLLPHTGRGPDAHEPDAWRNRRDGYLHSF